MAALSEVQLSEEAEADLNEIALYTREVWGEEASRNYVAALQVTLEMCRTYPELGFVARVDVRRMRHERHVIFYRAVEDVLWVVRILHEKRLPPRVL